MVCLRSPMIFMTAIKVKQTYKEWYKEWFKTVKKFTVKLLV